jgi:hypothetical protein
MQHGFKICKADSTILTRKVGNNLFICQIYVNDIIFSSTNQFFVMSLA